MEVSENQTILVADEKTRRIYEKLKRELGALLYGIIKEPDVIEVMLNPDGRLWVERLGQDMLCVGKMSASQAESLISTVAATLKTTITRENPILECEFPLDGSRFEALIPPVVSAPVFSLRRKALKIFTFDDYVAAGTMTSRQRDVISKSVGRRKNILVVGGTTSGKTTLTNAIIAEIAALTPEHRLVIIEDTAEIQCSSDNAVILRAVEAADMLRLLKATLRLRPDRVLVGEVRGAEALALLKAWNTGHPGGVATVHANHALAGLIRMEQLIAESTLSPMQSLIAEAIDLVIYIEKTAQGRKIKQIILVEGFKENEYVFSTLE